MLSKSNGMSKFRLEDELMKVKKITALMVISVMMLGVSPAFAWRTGSRGGDTAAYGAGGAVVGGAVGAGVVWWLTGTLSVLCPPVAVAAAVGTATLGWYGATERNKTLESDVEAVARTAGYSATAAGAVLTRPVQTMAGAY